MPIRATYRLQLNASFGFRDAASIVDYLDELGVTHAYASPYLAAQPGSTHGYDLTDPTRLNPELGAEADYVAWTRALGDRGMGHIVDVVPNHMAASTENAWWRDVLENGPSSAHADHFDIEWHPPKDALENKVLLPVLGAQYGEVLEKGELRVARDEGVFCVRYWERCLPVSPPSTAQLLARAAASLPLPPEDPKRQELESIVTGTRNLPASHETDAARRLERAREKEVLKRRLAAVCEDADIAAAIDREVTKLNGVAGDPRSFDELDRFLLDQCYRLAFWRVATEEINYRRFFDVNDLAAVRMESDAVFDDAHTLLLRFVTEGRLQGIRLDHTDGLYDPAEYFAKLRRAMDGVYLVCEKILAPGEDLPRTWPIEGTTGYDFLASASGIFVDRRAESAMTRTYQTVTGDTASYAEHVLAAKRSILRSSLSSELHMLAVRLERIAMRDRRSRDFTLAMLRRALGETIASFPVYRTYVRPDGTRQPNDEATLVRAIRMARRRNADMSPSVFAFLRDVLLLAGEPADRDARVEVAMRFQQLTGPVAAKGVEDTAFYTYLRFTALNEVGGTPDRFGTSAADFHASNATRRERWPLSMIANATHDTKRGADVRARLAVLSEMPERWAGWVEEWLALAAQHVRAIEEEPAPSRADQYLFFQTALGAYPFSGADEAYAERLASYMLKAAREAKLRTSWLSPDDAYEDALRSFVIGMMNDGLFARSLADKARTIATHGASNGLALVALCAASPGVADTYQGCELWDLALVDPDNRVPVDYATRRTLLERAREARPRELLASFEDARVKLHVLSAALRLRREREAIFIEGDYAAIDGGEDVVAFARRHASGAIVCAVTRQPLAVTKGEAPWAVGDVWGNRTLALPPGAWRDAFSGRTHDIGAPGLRASRLFEDLPVALLVQRRERA